MPQSDFSDYEYRERFIFAREANVKDIHAKALERALDIRKFEIELYWKRAAYFWTFIAATLAGFIAIQSSSSTAKSEMSVLLCCLGVVFSVGWVFVNRGSKFWQENWEYHVDMLEDNIQGPLYKVVLSRRDPSGINEYLSHLLTGPSQISVSKINLLISNFIAGMWICLLLYSLWPINPSLPADVRYCVLVFLTAFTCFGFWFWGKSYTGGYWHKGSIRTALIKNE